MRYSATCHQALSKTCLALNHLLQSPIASNPTCMSIGTHRSTSLFLDWDGTIASTDTLSAIAAIGYARNAQRQLPAWSYFTEAYIKDVAAHTATYRPQKPDRKSIDQELDWLESLVDVERASVERVEAAGVFEDVTITDIRTATHQAAKRQEVQLRPGLKELLKVLHDRKGSASIISVNWSAVFISEFIRVASDMAGWSWAAFAGIYANEIESGPSGRLTRHFAKENRGVWTAKDKSRVLKEVIAENSLGIYIGDSLTDLGCLMSVDIGICMRDEPMGSEQASLAEALVRLGIPCGWIGEYYVPLDNREGPLVRTSKTLWWARDFKDIADSPLFVS